MTRLFVTTAKASDELGIQPGTLLRLAKEFRIPCIRPSRSCLLFYVPDVVEALRAESFKMGPFRRGPEPFEKH